MTFKKTILNCLIQLNLELIMAPRNLASYYSSMAVLEIITGVGRLILRDRENIMCFVFLKIRRQPIIFYPERQVD